MLYSYVAEAEFWTFFYQYKRFIRNKAVKHCDVVLDNVVAKADSMVHIAWKKNLCLTGYQPSVAWKFLEIYRIKIAILKMKLDFNWLIWCTVYMSFMLKQDEIVWVFKTPIWVVPRRTIGLYWSYKCQTITEKSLKHGYWLFFFACVDNYINRRETYYVWLRIYYLECICPANISF